VWEKRKIVEANEALLLVNIQFAQCANVLELNALLLIKNAHKFHAAPLHTEHKHGNHQGGDS
jgi:hypothetical protein